MERVPYNPSEIVTTETYPSMFAGAPGSPKYNTPITPKENYKALLRREIPMWIPIGSDTLLMSPRIDPDNMARVFAFEAVPMAPDEMTGGLDKFGVEWVYVPVAGGSMVKPGNPILEDVNDWEKVIKFPNVAAWDWETHRKSNAEYVSTDRLISITILTGFFERLISFMDFENAAMAMIDEDQQPAIHALFDKLADTYNEMVDHYIDVFKMDQLWFHDDWGSQRAPFFSLNTAREMIVPHLKKVVDHCHSKGVFFDMHSCGKNELLVPAYIEAGCDAWTGQTMNDKEMLYEMYGDKLIMGVESDVSEKYPFGGPPCPPEEAAASAKRFIEKYGPDFAAKPVVGGFGMDPTFAETLYVESRKLFSK